MAVAFTAAKTGTLLKSWTVTAADADTSGTQAHGLASIPNAFVTPAIAFAQGATADATNLTFLKTNAMGSGGAMAGTSVISTVYAWIFHSILA